MIIIMKPPTGTFVKFQLSPADKKIKTKETKGKSHLVSCGGSVIDRTDF